MTPAPPLAVVLGRFLPLHNGHLFLLSRALRDCGALLVLVRTRASDPFPPPLRARWISSLLPGPVRVVLCPEEMSMDPLDEGAVAAWGSRVRGATPDAWRGRPVRVYAGEDHGAALARTLGGSFVRIDRGLIPVSGTMIRRDPAAHLASVPIPVQIHLRRLLRTE